ncbi:MAG: penicillin-binding transpeptidase domain-containing protein [Desulfobacterales bacterium]
MKAESRKLETADLSLLREGMKAVPQIGGTAGETFKNYPEIRDNVSGKTGTANIGEQRDYFTVWFTGWNEKLTGNPDIPPLAFACMITHAHGSGKDTGGSAAAPVIAEMLRRLNGGNNE